MILAKRQNDLYENISDDFLTLRSNSMRAKAERMAKCKSVPSFISSNDLLRPDEQYVSSNQNEDGFMRRRNQWSTASYQRPPNVYQMAPPSQQPHLPSIPSRTSHARRSMSILDDKENCNPCQFLPPLKPRCSKDAENSKQELSGVLRPAPKKKSYEVMRGSPKGYRLSSGASLSPHSKIFSAPRT